MLGKNTLLVQKKEMENLSGTSLGKNNNKSGQLLFNDSSDYLNDQTTFSPRLSGWMISLFAFN